MTLGWLVKYHVPPQRAGIKKKKCPVPMIAVRNMYSTSFLCESIQQPLSWQLVGDQKVMTPEKTGLMWTVTVTTSLSWWLNKELDFINVGSSLWIKGLFPDPPILKKTNGISTSWWETQMGIEKHCCQPLSPSIVDDLLTCHPMIHYLILAILNCISPEALWCLISVLYMNSTCEENWNSIWLMKFEVNHSMIVS